MSKKLPLILTSLVFTTSSLLTANEESLPPAPQASSFAPFTGAISGSKVRLRIGPSVESHVVRETTFGELFAITGEVEGYYTVAPPPDTKGYVFRTFVLDGVVEGERVNVRLYPDIEAPVIGRLNTGDTVHAAVSDINNKWLEIDMPSSCHFYIAKDYVENKGPVELIAQLDKRHHEATHLLSSAFLFAQSEIQKPFAQVDMDAISEKFARLYTEFTDLPDIANRAHEANTVIQDIYIQKKIAFLESQAERSPSVVEIDPAHLDRLAELGIEIKPAPTQKNVVEIADAAADTIGLSSTFSAAKITDKMLVWEPLEESLFHLWAAANSEETTLDDFYAQEEENATVLTGIVEPYTRPVKNRPGDFLLRSENLPVAFLYSTRVNLQNLVGQKITLIASRRPNNNFAFPAYFVLSAE